MRKNIFILAVFCFVLVNKSFANQAFDDVKNILLFDNTKIKVVETLKAFKGRRISGCGYIRALTVDVDGQHFCNIYTDNEIGESVEILLFFRKFSPKKAKKLTVGKKVFFTGTLDDIKMDMLILKRGNIR